MHTSPSSKPPFARLLLQLLPGFLPLLIYVLVEEVWGESIAIIAAIGFGLIEFTFILIKEKRADWLAAVDVLLLALMGGISLALHDDAFFMLKPALLEGLIAILVGISAFTKTNLLMGKSLRAIDTSAIPPELIEQRIKSTLRLFFFVLLIHIAATILSAFLTTKEIWLFVSGPLLYILVGLAFLPTIIKAFFLRKR